MTTCLKLPQSLLFYSLKYMLDSPGSIKPTRMIRCLIWLRTFGWKCILGNILNLQRKTSPSSFLLGNFMWFRILILCILSMEGYFYVLNKQPSCFLLNPNPLLSIFHKPFSLLFQELLISAFNYYLTLRYIFTLLYLYLSWSGFNLCDKFV